MNIEAEEIRIIQNKFRDYDLTEYFDNFEEDYNSIPIKSIGPGENMTRPTSVYVENMAFGQALFTGLERLAPILTAPVENFIHGVPIEVILFFDRNFYYFLENAKDGLRKTSERMCVEIVDKGIKKYENISTVIYIYIYI